MPLLKQITQYYNTIRGVGHTYNIIHGLKNADKPVLIGSHGYQTSAQIARECQNPNVQPFSNWGNTIRGGNLPLVFDHTIFFALAQEQDGMVVRWNENLRLERKEKDVYMDSLKEVNGALKNTIRQLCKTIEIQKQTEKDLSDALHIKECVIRRLREKVYPLKSVYHEAEINEQDQKSWQWFYDRIGKTIYRSWDNADQSCIREDHVHTPVIDIIIADEQHAFYIHMYSEIHYYRDTPYLALLPQFSLSTLYDVLENPIPYYKSKNYEHLAQ